jgi:hypothetical protein
VKHDIETTQWPRRILYFQVLPSQRQANGDLTLTGVIANTSYDRRALIGDDVRLVWVDSTAKSCYQGRLTWNGGQSSLVVLDSAGIAAFHGRFRRAHPDCRGSGSHAWAQIALVDILDPTGPRRLISHWSPSDSRVSLHSRLGPGIRIAFRFKPFGLDVRGDDLVGNVGLW